MQRKADWEGFVRFGGSRYSVPPEIAGKTVMVIEREQKVRIGCEQMIIAEHPRAERRGATVADPDHLAAMWKLTLGRTEDQILPRWTVRFDAPVATAPLTVFEQVMP